jgi:hypothetical protein
MRLSKVRHDFCTTHQMWMRAKRARIGRVLWPRGSRIAEARVVADMMALLDSVRQGRVKCHIHPLPLGYARALQRPMIAKDRPSETTTSF